MYQQHPDFLEPDNLETTVWRYRPYGRFLSILEHHALYFSSIKALQEMEDNDKDEGTFPPKNIRDYLDAGEQAAQRQPEDEEGIGIVTTTTSNQFYGLADRIILPYMVANCWNIGEEEDENMWRVYASDNAKEGVAMRTTFKRLTESFDGNQKKLYYANDTEIPVHAGKVCYINRDEQRIPDDPLGWPLVLQKGKGEFEHEHELRVAADFNPRLFGLTLDHNVWKQLYPPDKAPAFLKRLIESGGIYIPVELSTLIETVVISPFAQPELRQKVEDALRDNDIDADVELSRLKHPL